METVRLLKFVELFGVFIGIMVLTFIVATIFRRAFGRYVRYSTEVLKNDPTNYKFLKHSISGLIYLIGIGMALYSLPAFKAVASSMLTGAGILAVVAGIASQHALSNVMSGVFIIIFKPFRVNDRLRIRDTLNGIVEDITLRHTVIRDFENKRIIIPNTVISNEIIVNSDFANEQLCRWIDIGISFDSDLKKAKEIMLEEVEKHPLNLDVRTPEDIAAGAPVVQVRVVSLGESAVNLRAWSWAKNAPDAFVLACDLLESIKLRFDREGIEIPFPHRTIVYKEKGTSILANEEASKKK